MKLLEARWLKCQTQKPDGRHQKTIDILKFLIAEYTVAYFQAYTLYSITLSWSSAKRACECIGHLVVIDTEMKQRHLLDNVYVCSLN